MLGLHLALLPCLKLLRLLLIDTLVAEQLLLGLSTAIEPTAFDFLFGCKVGGVGGDIFLERKSLRILCAEVIVVTGSLQKLA